MIRRRFTLKRVDPWSVLKFGFVVNIALMLVAMLGFWILWIVIQRLGLVETFCGSVGEVVLNLEECSLNGGNIFRTLLLLGLLGVVVQTGIMVFGAFLYNLIADLTGGLGFTFLDESGEAARTTARVAEPAAREATREPRRDASAEPAGARPGAAGPGPTSVPRPVGGPGGPPDQSSTPRSPTPDGPPRGPGSVGGPPAPPASTPGPSPSTGPPSTESGQPRRDSSGSLWGDPTRSNERS